MSATPLSTTQIARPVCNMAPDCCPEADYLVTGETLHGHPFRARIHHHLARCCRIEHSGQRETWSEFASLGDAVAYLERGGRDSTR